MRPPQAEDIAQVDIVGSRDVGFGGTDPSSGEQHRPGAGTGPGGALNVRETAMNHAYRWAIVAAAGLLGCVAVGAMFSLPVFLRPMALATGWSITGLLSAMTIGFLAMAAASMAWGGLSDRSGCGRWC
jgi:hypothetical protein